MNHFGYTPQSYGAPNQAYGQNNTWDNFTGILSARGRTFDEIKNASDKKAIIMSLGIHDALEIAAIETEWSKHMNDYNPYYQQQQQLSPQPQAYNTTASAPQALQQLQQHQAQQHAPPPSSANNWGDVQPSALSAPCPKPGEPTININIKALTGTSVSLDNICPRWTVEQLKMCVADRLSTPPAQQRLIFAGRQLEDHATLSSYNIKDGCTLHLVMRLGGTAAASTATSNNNNNNNELASLQARLAQRQSGGGGGGCCSIQ